MSRYAYDADRNRTRFMDPLNAEAFRDSAPPPAGSWTGQRSGAMIYRYDFMEQPFCRAFDAWEVSVWLNRDPVEEYSSRNALFRLANSLNIQSIVLNILFDPPQGNLYVYVQNNPSSILDVLGLALSDKEIDPCCTGLTFINPGKFVSNVIDHYFRDGPASSLTFNVRCPTANPYLNEYDLTSMGAPPRAPAAHPFPSGWTRRTVSSKAPDYTIVVDVPSTTALRWSGDLERVRIEAICCKTESQ